MRFVSRTFGKLRAAAQKAPAKPIGRSVGSPNAASAFRLREPLSTKSVQLRSVRSHQKPQISAIFRLFGVRVLR